MCFAPFRFGFSQFRTTNLQWSPSCSSSIFGLKMKNSEASWRSRPKPPCSAKDQWQNLSSTSGGSGSKNSNTDIYNVGAGDWVVQNFEPCTDCGFVNNQTQHQASLVRQPAKVTQTTSIMEPSLFEPISVTNFLKLVHQSQHNHCGE